MAKHEWTCKQCLRTFRVKRTGGSRKTVCRQCANIKQYINRREREGRSYYRKYWVNYETSLRGDIAEWLGDDG